MAVVASDCYFFQSSCLSLFLTKCIGFQVANTDKQLVTLIHSKGLLCFEVQELYHRVCSSYEKILLNDYDQAELQDVEYSLWKLHYRHIDEFRKRIKKSSASDNTMLQSGANVQRSRDNHIDGFKTFLSEAITFYHNLVVKIKRYYGLPEESSFAVEGYISTTVEPNKRQKYQFLCHRFLVCLGDLARYKEQYENFGAQEHNWSVAVSHYLEATMIWPDSGNPQNQVIFFSELGIYTPFVEFCFLTKIYIYFLIISNASFIRVTMCV